MRRTGAIALAVLCLALNACQGYPERIEAEEIVLRDKRGVARILIGVKEGDTPEIKLCAPSGDPVTSINVIDGNPGIAMSSPASRASIVIASGQDGAMISMLTRDMASGLNLKAFADRSELRVGNLKDGETAVLSVLAEGTGGLALEYGRKLRAALLMYKDGRPDLSLYGRRNKAIWSAP